MVPQHPWRALCNMVKFGSVCGSPRGFPFINYWFPYAAREKATSLLIMHRAQYFTRDSITTFINCQSISSLNSRFWDNQNKPVAGYIADGGEICTASRKFLKFKRVHFSITPVATGFACGVTANEVGRLLGLVFAILRLGKPKVIAPLDYFRTQLPRKTKTPKCTSGLPSHV